MAAIEPAAGSRQPDDTGAAVDSERERASGGRAGRQPVPKLRERKHGAAVPLSDLDKRLLNLMQGSFPIAARPYQHVASKAGLSEDEAIERVRHLIDERIIRQ